MKPLNFILITGLLLTISQAAQSQEWAIQADAAESCSCDPACPCVFGSEPTQGICDANRLVRIKKGHYGNVDLAGLDVIISFQMGEWARYYVSDQATDEQVEAAKNLISTTMHFDDYQSGVISVEKAPVAVEENSKITKYSSPFASVEIERLEGPDGQPMKLKNTLVGDFDLYKSRENNYEGKEENFSYSGTNGFRWVINEQGED